MSTSIDKDKEYNATKLLESLGYSMEHESYYTCDCCGKSKALKQNHYYQTNNQMYDGCKVSYEVLDKNKKLVRLNHSVLPFCKTCIEKMYNDFMIDTAKDEKLSMFKLCNELRLPWIESHWDMASSSKSSSWKIYIGKLSGLPQMASLTVRDSEPYIGNTSDSIVEYEDVQKFCSKPKLNELRSFWGNFPESELIWLQEQYDDWASRHTIDTKALEILIGEICQQQLTIKRMREDGNNVSKELKDLQELMNSSALKPIQESVAMSNEANTLGIWIKRIENEDPITEVEEKYKDVDGLGKLIRVFFLGHFNKMMGVKNELSEEYELEMAKYTVNLEDGDE